MYRQTAPLLPMRGVSVSTTTANPCSKSPTPPTSTTEQASSGVEGTGHDKAKPPHTRVTPPQPPTGVHASYLASTPAACLCPHSRAFLLPRRDAGPPLPFPSRGNTAARPPPPPCSRGHHPTAPLHIKHKPATAKTQLAGYTHATDIITASLAPVVRR